MKKRLLCCVSALTVLLATTDIYALGNTKTEYQSALYKSDSDTVSLFETDSSAMTDEVYSALKQKIYEAAKNKVTDLIDITEYKIPYKNLDTLTEIVYNTTYENPDLFYLKSGFSYSVAQNPKDDDIILSIRLKYTSHTSDEDSAEFFSKVNYILASVIKDGMTDEDKALALHDYIVDNTEYGLADIQEDSYTPYSVIMNNIGVCQGYSLAYNLLLNRTGINTKYVSSKSMNHGWSMVMLENEWYHCDVTWDDPTNTEIVNHKYFLLSDDSIKALDHTGWNADAPLCTSKKYEDDNYCFIMTQCLMKYKNGKFYYKDFKKVEYSDIPPGQSYYPIDGEYYVTEYVGTKFDGSARENITSDFYNELNEQNQMIFNPIKYDDKNIMYLPQIGDLAKSAVYIKTENGLTDKKIYIVCFGTEKNLIDIIIPQASEYENYAEIRLDSLPENTESIKILMWEGSVKPASNALCIEK